MEKVVKRAQETKEYFSKLYNIPTSSIVWCGGERYIVITEEKEIKIGF